MKPALHRSITFWSGLLAMVFFLWAWRDSFRNDTHATTYTIVSASGWGGVMVMHDPTIHSGPRFGGAMSFGRRPDLLRGKQRDFFQRPFALRGQGSTPTMPPESPSFYDWCVESMATHGPHVRMIFLPYWLILLAVAIPWLGLLIWRARRRKTTTLQHLNP